MDPRKHAARWVSAAMAAVLVVAGSLLQGGSGAQLWVNLVLLAVVFVLPAQGLYAPRDVRTRWKLLLGVAVLGTFVWDVATGAVAGDRPFFSEWYLVYTSGPLTFMILYLIHAWLAALLAGRLAGSAPG
jgi:hypothetical protein